MASGRKFGAKSEPKYPFSVCRDLISSDEPAPTFWRCCFLQRRRNRESPDDRWSPTVITRAQTGKNIKMYPSPGDDCVFFFFLVQSSDQINNTSAMQRRTPHRIGGFRLNFFFSFWFVKFNLKHRKYERVAEVEVGCVCLCFWREPRENHEFSSGWNGNNSFEAWKFVGVLIKCGLQDLKVVISRYS